MIKEEIDFKGFSLNGFLMLFISIVVFAGCAYLLHLAVPKDNDLLIALSVTGIVLSLMTLPGYFALEPNEALIMIFFGKYSGTFKNTGFYWVNPFYAKKKVSLRARNLDVEPIKVNDKIGNPVLIGLVLVWKLKDTYKAMFDIDAQTMASSGRTTTINNAVASRMSAFENFVMIQSDAALRQDSTLMMTPNITLTS